MVLSELEIKANSRITIVAVVDFIVAVTVHVLCVLANVNGKYGVFFTVISILFQWHLNTMFFAILWLYLFYNFIYHAHSSIIKILLYCLAYQTKYAFSQGVNNLGFCSIGHGSCHIHWREIRDDPADIHIMSGPGEHYYQQPGEYNPNMFSTMI